MTILSAGYGKGFDGNSILVEITDKDTAMSRMER